MTRTDTLLAAAVPDIVQRLLALDAVLFSDYARHTPALAAMGFPECVMPPGFSMTDLADISSSGGIEILFPFQDLPVMGVRFSNNPVQCAGVAVRNVYCFWRSPMLAFVGHMRHRLCLTDTEIIFRLSLATLLLLRRRAIRHAAYFPKLRFYRAKDHGNLRNCSFPNDPVSEDNLVFFELLLRHLKENSTYADYLRVLPLFVNERM